MFELKNANGYVMWSIKPDRVERQCILYSDDGTECDPVDMDEPTVRRIVVFSAWVATMLRDVEEVERHIYLQNLPMLLQIGTQYTTALRKNESTVNDGVGP